MSDRKGADTSQRIPPMRISNFALALFVIFAATAIVGCISRYSLAIVLFDGGFAALILAPLVMGGFLLIPRSVAQSLEIRWHWLLAAVLGIGCGATLVLALGLFGILHRGLWLSLLATLGILGSLRALRLKSTFARYSHRVDTDAPRILWLRWSWLIAIPFLAMALLCASAAPGVLWQEEGLGYDVLEYHLQLPREYLQIGRIAYLPHNVYSAFPALVEMLYLLAMLIQGDAQEAGTIAHFLHLYLGALCVYAVWCIARDWSREAGAIAAILLATTGWMTYLSALAYNENGLLLFGIAALGFLLRGLRTADKPSGDAPREPSANHGWFLLSGISSGLACACKYTGAAFFAIPIFIAAVALSKKRLQSAAGFILGVLIAFSPWLLKNTYFTGNPGFPLAGNVFPTRAADWGPAEQIKWDAGHRSEMPVSSIAHRASQLWSKIIADPLQRFGPAVLILGALLLAFRARGRLDAALSIILVLQVLIWLFATHLFARFAVPLLAGLALLAGRGIISSRPARLIAIALALIAGAAWNMIFLFNLIRREHPGDAPASLFYEGQIPGFEFHRTVNKELAPESKILLVGESRAFYFKRNIEYATVFNRQPLAAALENDPSPQSIRTWLQARGVTHVLVNWAEIKRLRATYGFSESLHEELFDELVAANVLKRVAEFAHPASAQRYVELYEVRNQ